MSYYRPCSVCGAALDPGERCDCRTEKETAPVLEHRDGQKVESELSDPHSTSEYKAN